MGRRISRWTAILCGVFICVILLVSVFAVFEHNSNVNLRSQISAKNQKIDSLNAQINALNSNISKAESTISSLNASVASLQKQLKSESATNSALQTQISSDNTQIGDDSGQISTLDSELQSNPLIPPLQNELAAADNEVTSLQNEIASDQSTVETLNSQLSLADSTMANWDAPVQNGFSIVQITDTQFLAASYPGLFDTLTSWIVNNSAALNVAMVVHTGDIVNDPGNTTEWQAANTAMMQLYDNGVPYCWDAGNHDIIGQSLPTGNPNGVWIGGSGYSAFNVTLMQQEPYWVASIYNGSSTAVQFTYGNYHFLVINIEYDANQTVINWMQTLINCNPNANVIVATHNFLNGQGGYGFTPSPQDVAWAENFANIVGNDSNVFMTLNGHDINEGTAATKRVGNIEEIFFNRQQVDNLQGSACARIYTFNMNNPAQPTVSVYTYQMYASGSGGIGPAYLTDPSDQFNFTSDLIQYSPQTVSIPEGTPFYGASAYDVSFTNNITLSPVMQNIQGMYSINTEAAYNQTGDLLSFYNLDLNGATSNLTVSTVGSDIVISSCSATNIAYTVDEGGGTQTFMVSAAPTSVTINGNVIPAGGSLWSYSNGVLTVTGATSSVSISFT